MKKLISLVLVLVMALTVFAGCGKKDTPETTAPNTTTAPAVKTTSLEVMQAIWDSYMKNVSEDMAFPVAGGDTEHSTMDAAGQVDLKNTDYMAGVLNVPAELHAQIDDAASLMHMMNANTFTAGAYHVVAGTDVDAFVKTLTEGIKGTQWMCGFPDQLIVATVHGEYVVAFYGAAEIVDAFKTQLTAAHADAKIIADESLA